LTFILEPWTWSDFRGSRNFLTWSYLCYFQGFCCSFSSSWEL